MPIFNHPSSDGGPEKGVNEGKINSVHLSKYNDHLYDFYVVEEGLNEFAVEADEKYVKVVDPPLSQFLKNNISHMSKRSMAAHSQSEVPTEEAEDIVPSENLSSEIVQIEPCKRKGKNASKSHVTITHLHRQGNKKNVVVVQIRASQRIANKRISHSTTVKADKKAVKKKRKTNFVDSELVISSPKVNKKS